MPVSLTIKNSCLLPRADEEGFTVAAYTGSLITSAEGNVAICVARKDWEDRLKDVACKRFSAYLPLGTYEKNIESINHCEMNGLKRPY